MNEEQILINHLDGDRIVYTDRHCFQEGERIGKYLGGGSYGEVNVICLRNELAQENKCGHVIKAIDLDDEEVVEEDVEKEIAMHKIASSLGLGPQYVKDFRCKAKVSTKGGAHTIRKYQFIITERYDVDIGTYLEKYGDDETATVQITSLKKALIHLMTISLHYLFYHDDFYDKDNGVNEGNIVLRLGEGGNVKEAKFIDFSGNCVVGADPGVVKKMWKSAWKNLRDDYEAFKNVRLDEEGVLNAM